MLCPAYYNQLSEFTTCFEENKVKVKFISSLIRLLQLIYALKRDLNKI